MAALKENGPWSRDADGSIRDRAGKLVASLGKQDAALQDVFMLAPEMYRALVELLAHPDSAAVRSRAQAVVDKVNLRD